MLTPGFQRLAVSGLQWIVRQKGWLQKPASGGQ